MNKLDEIHHRHNADFVTLQGQWIATRQAWKDPVADQFESQYWQQVCDESIRYLNALRDVSDILQLADINTRE